jgi:Tfp pilus assembly protein PilF
VTSANFDHLRKSVKADGMDELAQFRLGRAYMEAGHHMQAVPIFRRCIELNPQYAEAWLWLARAYVQTGVPKEAAASYEEARRAADMMGDSMTGLEATAEAEKLAL